MNIMRALPSLKLLVILGTILPQSVLSFNVPSPGLHANTNIVKNGLRNAQISRPDAFQRKPSNVQSIHNHHAIANKLPRATSLQLNAVPLASIAVATKTSATSILSTLHADPFYVLSTVLLMSTFGLASEQRTKIGKALSAPLVTMAAALVVANIGLMPFSSPVYGFINSYLIKLAIPLLLFDSDLRRVFTDTGSLLLAFIVGGLSTVIGTLVTYKFIPLTSLGENGWKVASALAARHIGGAINFVAVSETLDMSGSIVSAAIAADNIVVAFYFAFLFYLAVPGEGLKSPPASGDDAKGESAVTVFDPEDTSEQSGSDGITMSSLAISLTVATCIVTIGKILTQVILPSGASALPLISIVTVIGATLFPTFFQSLRSTGTSIGIVIMQMFLAASGAAGSIRLVMQSAPSLFLFSGGLIGIHFLSLMIIGRLLLRLNMNELLLASNANVGGPTTAATMATVKGWTRLTLPAMLVGILGYASATPIALLVGQAILRFK